MKRLFLAVASLAALTASASAADLARPAPQQYYKAPIASPVYNWTGFYIGINGGGGFGRSAWDTTGGFDTSGGVVGGTAFLNMVPISALAMSIALGHAPHIHELAGAALVIAALLLHVGGQRPVRTAPCASAAALRTAAASR